MQRRLGASFMTLVLLDEREPKAMLRRLFLDHPREVGQSYFGHQRNAFFYAASLLGAAIACFVHGLVPALFLHTGSRVVARLSELMAANRIRRM